MNIRRVGAELFYADWRTDRHDEANGRFSQFCEKRLKNLKILNKNTSKSARFFLTRMKAQWEEVMEECCWVITPASGQVSLC